MVLQVDSNIKVRNTGHISIRMALCRGRVIALFLLLFIIIFLWLLFLFFLLRFFCFILLLDLLWLFFNFLSSLIIGILLFLFILYLLLLLIFRLDMLLFGLRLFFWLCNVFLFIIGIFFINFNNILELVLFLRTKILLFINSFRVFSGRASLTQVGLGFSGFLCFVGLNSIILRLPSFLKILFLRFSVIVIAGIFRPQVNSVKLRLIIRRAIS
mmetsp:Transcript_1693/g.1536  ORF Transcript_1693/g.1536 Transcript_1693/m.1536 type:complete len:213 (+) Transcript_1693:493-1131(+)